MRLRLGRLLLFLPGPLLFGRLTGGAGLAGSCLLLLMLRAALALTAFLRTFLALLTPVALLAVVTPPPLLSRFALARRTRIGPRALRARLAPFARGFGNGSEDAAQQRAELSEKRH